MIELISNFFSGGYSLLGYLLAFVAVLTPVVFVHEMGHFLVGRWCGVKVETFSIGMGKEIWGFNDKHGTRWRISALPIGGYVRFFGDLNAASQPDGEHAAQMSEEEKQVSFPHKSVGQRAAVTIAGPIANFLLAIVIFTLTFSLIGRGYSDPVVSSVKPDSAAQSAGILPGDIVREIDGTKIRSFSDIPLLVAPNAGRQLAVKVERQGEVIDFKITPQEMELEDQFGGKQKIGIIGITSNIEDANYRFVKLGPIDSFTEALRQTWYQIKIPLIFIKDIFIGKKSPDILGGPVKIAKYSGNIATIGVFALIQFVAFVSIAIGLMNLFPIPLLDGGHLVFYAIEAIRGKPLSLRVQEIGFSIGLFLILSLMIFTTYNDIMK